MILLALLLLVFAIYGGLAIHPLLWLLLIGVIAYFFVGGTPVDGPAPWYGRRRYW